MPTQPSVTVVIPCFNADSYIHSVLESINNQTVVPEEILIIDDGSRDNTRPIVEKLSNVQLIVHDQNRGIAASRNSGWRAAEGEIIVYIDADGIADPQFLEKLLAKYRDDTVGGVGGHGIESIQETIYDRWRKEILFQHWGDSFRDDVYFLFGLCSSYRRKVLQEINGFDPLFRVSGEDMDIGFRICKAGYKLAYAPEAIVHHQRLDNLESIQKMTYRHCFWGFLAQRKNNTFSNKISTFHSFQTLMRHLLVEGCLKANFPFSFLSLRLHLLILRAWLDAGKSYATMIRSGTLSDTPGWEGHSKTDESV